MCFVSNAKWHRERRSIHDGCGTDVWLVKSSLRASSEEMLGSIELHPVNMPSQRPATESLYQLW